MGSVLQAPIYSADPAHVYFSSFQSDFVKSKRFQMETKLLKMKLYKTAPNVKDIMRKYNLKKIPWTKVS